MSVRPAKSPTLPSALVAIGLAALCGDAPAQADDPGALAAPSAEAVAQAVERATGWLLLHQQRDGSWSEEHLLYPSGQTAFSAYALLKAGLGAEHPSVQRAVAFVAQAWPEETYALGVELVLLEALRDPARRERMQGLVERLLEIQLDGEWGYPLTHNRPTWIPRVARADLSNTQYAVLGLRAAHFAGVEVPRRQWQAVFDAALRYQAPPRAVDDAAVARKSAGRVLEAGFRYLTDGSRAASGSMTAAGLTVLGVAREVLGERLDRRREKQLEEALEHGLRWIEQRWSVSENPGEAGWHKYWLYGLERIGALYGLEAIGPHAWYAEGARELIGSQAPDGSWGGSQADTCFAVLFLQRATSAASSERLAGGTARDAFASAEEDAVRLRGTGQPRISLWIDSPSPAARAAHPEGLFVERVEYLVDGVAVAEVPGDPSRPWEGERFPARYEFEQRGARRVSARVHLAPPPGSGAPAPQALSTGGFEVQVPYALEDWMLDFASSRSRNLLAEAPRSASASSQLSPGEGPEQAFDAWQSTRWLAAEDDEQPWIRLELVRGVEADRVVLSQATPVEAYRGYRARALAVDLVLNREDAPLRLRLEPDELRPTVVELGRTRMVRQLELRVRERVAGAGWPRQLGFAEIALERDP